MKNYNHDDIDIEALQELNRTNPLFTRFIEFLACQKENVRQLTVGSVVEEMNRFGFRVGRNDVVRMFQALNGKNCGWFTVGRKGWPSRFYFEAPMIELAREVMGINRPVVSMKKPATTITHRFRLRAELEVKFELPEDLTEKEVGRIADFLKTLPFEEADLSKAA